MVFTRSYVSHQGRQSRHISLYATPSDFSIEQAARGRPGHNLLPNLIHPDLRGTPTVSFVKSHPLTAEPRPELKRVDVCRLVRKSGIQPLGEDLIPTKEKAIERILCSFPVLDGAQHDARGIPGHDVLNRNMPFFGGATDEKNIIHPVLLIQA
jgi:hypothetical protein